MPQITGMDLHAVIEAAVRRAADVNDDDVILSMLTRALIAAAKANHVPKATVVRELERAWDETHAIGSKILAPTAFNGLKPAGLS